MSGPLFFVEDLSQGQAWLGPEDSRHALRAVRLRRGEEVTVADGRGAVARGKLGGERDGSARIDLERTWRVERPRPVLEVGLAPPKGDRLAWAVQKLAELGVDRVTILRTERGVRAWDESRQMRAVARLRAVSREAAMQARRPFVTEVFPPVSLDALAGPGAVMLNGEARLPLAKALARDPGTVRLLVGPEGGFTDAEAALAEASGVAMASLGEGILRTETAAVVGASLVLARYGRLG